MMDSQYCIPNEDLPEWAKPKPKGAPSSEVNIKYSCELCTVFGNLIINL